MKSHSGRCHCGKVKFEVISDLAKVISCNCSYCHKHGLILTFVKAESMKILEGKDSLTEYQFNTKKIHHLFCKVCGVEPFGQGNSSDGSPTYAINVRCLEGVDLNSLTLIPVDGKNF